MALDWYGDPILQEQGLTSGGMYYYLLTGNRLKSMLAKNLIPIPPTDSVVNVCYYPYLNGYKNALTQVVNLDTDRFPLANNLQLTDKSLYRIGSLPISNEKIGTFKRYSIPSASRSTGGDFDWRKEGKLYQYPFTKLELNDYISTPLEIQPHLFNNQTNSQSVYVRHALNNQGMYLMYVEGYKGDYEGLISGVVTAGLNIPVTSSFYMDYMARNQESLKASRTTALLSGVGATVATATMGAKMGSAAGPWGMLAGGIAGAGVGMVTGSSGYRQSLAQEKDAQATPATLTATGGDVLFNMQIADGTLYAHRYRYTDEVMNRIGYFFHLYGYAQNTLMKPNTRNRHFYNYIKTQDVNLKSNGVPKLHLDILQRIYNSGVTIWHADNDGVTIKDYTKDNYEV